MTYLRWSLPSKTNLGFFYTNLSYYLSVCGEKEKRQQSINMAQKVTPIFTTEGAKPLPQFSQAVVYNGLVYVSGNVAFKPGPKAELVEGMTKDRAVSDRT